jgi:hypothetical protein
MARLIDQDVLEDAVQGAINIMLEHGISMIAASVPLGIIRAAPHHPRHPGGVDSQILRG